MSLLPSTTDWVSFPKPREESELRLFCVPYAGAGASLFNSWVDLLPSGVEICAIQLPGHESNRKGTPFTELTPLVEALAEALRPFLNTRFALFGHSMGALISFELARSFRRRFDLAPVHLFVSGHRAPQLPDPHPPVHTLPDKEFIEEVKRLEGTPEGVLEHPELLELLLPLLRADFQLCETYVYCADEPLTCPISAFGGSNDPRVSTAALSAWQAQTPYPLDLRLFPGEHFFLNSLRGLFLRILGQRLAQKSHQ